MDHFTTEYMAFSCKNNGLLCEFILKPYTENTINSRLHYHFHSTYEIHIPISGELKILVEDENITIKPGSVCILPPNSVHYVFDDQSIKRISFRFALQNIDETDHDIKNLFLNAFLPMNKVTVIHDCQIYDKYIRHAYENYLLGRPDFMISQLLFLALYELAVEIKPMKSMHYTTGLEHSNILVAEKIEVFLNSHYNKEICLGDLAKSLNLSERQTQRLIKSLFGMSFSLLLNKRRLASAKLLIKTSNYSLKEIADISGFHDQSYFYRRFTSAVGITPGNYRNEMLKSMNRETEHIQKENFQELSEP